MLLDTLISYFPFFLASVVGFFTPGPNNIMIVQSCILFGYKKTLPLILGVIIGGNTLFFSVSYGVSSLFNSIPESLIILKSIGTLYFIWFAYSIVTMDIETNYNKIHTTIETPQKNTSLIKKRTKPFGFFQAFFFQWINIKCILVFISIINLNPSSSLNLKSSLAMLGITVITAISSTHFWVLAGTFLKRFIKKIKTIKIINFILGLSLLWFCVSMWI